jgi:hypothetical protein
MPRTAPATAPFIYVDSDVPAGQTLVEWRRERNLERASHRPAVVRALRRAVHPRRS